MLRQLCLMLAATPLASPPPAAKPDALPPPVMPQCVGINIHFRAAPNQDLDGIQRAGAGWVRMDFAWADVEQAKGVYDFSQYDALLAGLSARRIKPLFVLDYGNSLYQQGSPRSPEARAAFARFAAAAARHFRGRTVLWEIWNEPNGKLWEPLANVREYGALALAAAHAIKSADPNATVIAPGTSGIPWDFLESLFRQGLLKEVDAVSVHPDRADVPESAGVDYQALRALIHQYAPPGKDIPLVSSEWGYPSVLTLSETQQAQFLAREWLFNLTEGVRLSIWYDWHDDGENPLDPQHHFGIIHADDSPKPAFLAAQTLTHLLAGYRFVKRIPLASDGDYLLLFARGTTSTRLAAWTTARDHTISLPLPAAASVAATTGGAVTAPDPTRFRLSLTGGPQYVVTKNDPALRQAASWAVQAANPFYSDGDALRIALTYRNPDARPHRVRFVIALRTGHSRRVTPVGSGEDIVAPGASLRVGAISADLSRVCARARIGLRLDGVMQPYPQDVSFAPSDALLLSGVPAHAGSAYLVTVGNPAGTAFQGWLTVTGNHRSRVPILLRRGQRSLTVMVPVGVFALLDARGNQIAVLPQPAARRPDRPPGRV